MTWHGNGVMRPGLATTLGMHVVAMWRSQLRVVYGGVRNGTVVYCNNMVKSTNHTQKKKPYPIGVSDEGVGLAGSLVDVLAIYMGYMLVSDRLVG